MIADYYVHCSRWFVNNDVFESRSVLMMIHAFRILSCISRCFHARAFISYSFIRFHVLVYFACELLISERGSDQGKNLDGEFAAEVVLEAGDEAGFRQELKTHNPH